jgi:signal transduction histidine kinase
VAQEALTNVLRHAGAGQVKMHLGHSVSGRVELDVRDDGCGFDASRETKGLGLLGAAERAAALGGTLQIESGPGSGTRLRLHLPSPSAPT